MQAISHAKFFRALGKWLVAAVLALSMVLSTAFVFATSRGYQLLSVQSDSMRPFALKGGAVVVDRNDTRAAVGDVVSYRSPVDATTMTINTHRVVAVDQSRGLMTTKGDNLSARDYVVPLRNVVGTVRFSLPYIGTLLDALKHPLGLVAAVYIPAISLIAYEARRLTRVYSSPPRRYTLYRTARG